MFQNKGSNSGKKKEAPTADIKPTKFLKEGMVEYHSPSLHVSYIKILVLNLHFLGQHRRDEVKGWLYKMAKEVKFLSTRLYYKRYWILNKRNAEFVI